jgi:hypothetical protein
MIAAPARDVNPVSLMAQDPTFVPNPHPNDWNPRELRPGWRAMADVCLTSSGR